MFPSSLTASQAPSVRAAAIDAMRHAIKDVQPVAFMLRPPCRSAFEILRLPDSYDRQSRTIANQALDQTVIIRRSRPARLRPGSQLAIKVGSRCGTRNPLSAVELTGAGLPLRGRTLSLIAAPVEQDSKSQTLSAKNEKGPRWGPFRIWRRRRPPT